MQRALCNAIMDGAEHTHICKETNGHVGNVHICSCGAIFTIVKESKIEKPLTKAN